MAVPKKASYNIKNPKTKEDKVYKEIDALLDYIDKIGDGNNLDVLQWQILLQKATHVRVVFMHWFPARFPTMWDSEMTLKEAFEMVGALIKGIDSGDVGYCDDCDERCGDECNGHEPIEWGDLD